MMHYGETKMLLNDRNNWSRLKSRIKWSLSPFPPLFIPLYRLTAPPPNLKLLITSDTQVVIEGFPRSGNTFAVVAFEMAQNQPVKIAHHLHVEAQIIEAVRRSLPVIVLLRNPLDAIRSLYVRHPEIDVSWAFKQYLSFYSKVESLSEKVIIAHFDDVTRNYGRVIRHVNKKFGSGFCVFEHNDLNTKLVFQQIEILNNIKEAGKATHLAIPNEERSVIYQKTNLEVPVDLRDKAINLYRILKNISRNY